MKKIMLVFIALLICVSPFYFASADNNYVVKNSIITQSDEFLDINISVPYFGNIAGVDEVNAIIEDIVADSIDQAKEAAESLKEYNKEYLLEGEEPLNWKSTLDIGYDYFINKDILSLQLNNYTYSGGAHGMYYIIPITMNIKTGEIYEFEDLFKDDKSVIERIENTLIQTIAKDPENYFEEYEESIKDKNGDFNFYIDGDQVVVYFDLYDIAPYSSGIHHFSFKAEEIKDILKDEVYNSIKGAKALEGILLNGVNYESHEAVFYDEYTQMIPLRTVAEALGHEVSWNKKDGPMVDGNSLKDVELKIVKGTTYVTLQYFTEILKENVSLGSSLYIDTSKAEYKLIENLYIRVFEKE